MIRGAIILAVGFGLGYGTAMRNQEEVRGAAVAFKQFLQDVKLEDDIQKKKAADAAAGAPAEPVVEAEAVFDETDAVT